MQSQTQRMPSLKKQGNREQTSTHHLWIFPSDSLIFQLSMVSIFTSWFSKKLTLLVSELTLYRLFFEVCMIKPQILNEATQMYENGTSNLVPCTGLAIWYLYPQLCLLFMLDNKFCTLKLIPRAKWGEKKHGVCYQKLHLLPCILLLDCAVCRMDRHRDRAFLCFLVSFS